MTKMKVTSFILRVVGPFRLDLTVQALRRRSKNNVDCWNGTQYIRLLCLENTLVKVQVEQKSSLPQIHVSATHLRTIRGLKEKLLDVLTIMLGLKIDLKWFYDLTKMNQVIHPLVLKFRGVKPPRFPTIFEALVNAISCQQLSLDAGISILNNLVKYCGKSFKEQDHIYYAFPEPSEIMKCDYEDLMKLGFSRNKSETLIRLSSEIYNNKEIFHNIEQMSNEDVIKLLCSFKGIGRWSAEYVLLRGLGRTDCIPGDDVAVQKNVKNLLKLRKHPEYDRIKKIETQWHPYAGLMYFHLLLEKLSQKDKLE